MHLRTLETLPPISQRWMERIERRGGDRTRDVGLSCTVEGSQIGMNEGTEALIGEQQDFVIRDLTGSK